MGGGNYAGSISGNAATLTKTGSGTLTLGGSNFYTGPTTLNAGTLKAGAANVFAPNSAVVVNGGTLDVTGFPEKLGGIDIESAGALNLTIGDVLNSSGAATLVGTLDLFGAGSGTTELIGYTSKTSQTFAAVNGLPSGDTLSYTSSALYLVAPLVTGPATWTALSGSWTSASNWSTGVVPSGSGVTAIVGSGTSSLRMITLDSPQTLGQLTFANSTNPATGYSLAPGVAGTLTMMSSSTSSAAQIYVTSGTHSLSAPLKLAGSLDISPSPGALLLIGGNISQSVAGSSLTLDNAGTLILSGSDGYTGGTLVTAGTLDVTAVNGLPNGGALTVGAGAGSLFASPAAGGVVLGGVQVATAGYPLGGNSAAAPVAVPEPGTLALLLAAGIAALTFYRRRRASGDRV